MVAASIGGVFGEYPAALGQGHRDRKQQHAKDDSTQHALSPVIPVSTRGL